MTLSRRTRMRGMSPRLRARLAEQAEVRAAVIRRDGCCVLAGTRIERCAGVLTPHHLRKASQGGPYTADNLVTLCVHHNDWVEDEPTAAHALGLVVRAGETTAEARERMRLCGLVVR